MQIVNKVLDPSRPDAVRLRRNEKMAMLSLMYAVTILSDLNKDMPERIRMVDRGEEKLTLLTGNADDLLNELRVTVPMDQRIGIHHTAMDYEVRLTPKLTPSETNVVMTKEEFRKLVDSARTKCHDCVDSEEECQACELFKVLTSVLPLDDYNGSNLCPYNLANWGN